jgi:hypothetical protein
MVAALIVVVAGFAGAANAATKITLECTLPTTRTDGSVFSTGDVGSVLFGYTQPGAAAQGPFSQATCGYVVNIPKGSCFKAGTVFTARVVDNHPTPLTSAPGSTTLTEDACNPFAVPSAPTVRAIVE